MARLARLRSQLDRRHPREIIDPRQTHRPLARGGLLVLTLAVSLPAMIGCGSSGKGGHSSGLVAIGAGLKGPSGLTATVYGKGPATVAALTFDPQGRLWLAAAGLEAHAQDGVYLLAKPGGRAVRIIAGLSDPLGLDWHAGSLYVSSIGRVDAFGGFNGRRFTQHTTVLRGPVPGGENNVLVMTPDGRFVMGVTASCDHCVPRSPFSGSIVSFRPDGGDLRLFARRIRAPVGLAYLPGTSNLLVSMNQRDDLGAATPGDWLAAVAEGQDWGFPGCYGQGGTTCAGVPAPIAVLDKHAAVGALAIMTGQLPGFTGTSAVVPEWQSGKVQRVPLRRDGSTYTGSVEPFLTGVQNPMGITFGPDRSLLVGDWATGTIYSIAARGDAP